MRQIGLKMTVIEYLDIGCCILEITCIDNELIRYRGFNPFRKF